MTAEHGTTLSIISLPGRENAVEVPWDPAMAKARGIFGFDSMDARSRSFNLIRARLLELQAKHGWRMIGVVSATPNVGKSFISANVAAALSRDPRFQTYVVDFDLASRLAERRLRPVAGARRQGLSRRRSRGLTFLWPIGPKASAC